MAEKLSWSELRRALAARTDVSEKNASAFMNAFISQLIEGLKSDKQVKINGLGTFKLQAVAPRKSVNVSTGEEIVIEGYNKIVFVPEAGVKELVEKNAAVGTLPVEEKAGEYPIDPIKKLGEQAEEIVGILEDLNKVESDEEPATKAEEPIEEEPKAEEPAVEEPAVEEPAVIIVEKPEKPQKKSHFLRDVLICLVILLLLLVGCYFFLRENLSGWMNDLLQPKAQTEQVEEVAPAVEDSIAGEETDPELALIPEGKIPQEQILDEWRTASGDETTSPNTYTDLITTEPMHEGSRLTWMSKRFYGDKRFWPYLYDANRDIITNPSHIEVGTPIRVPRLTAAQMDTTNAAEMAKLEQLRIEAEEACKK